MEVWRENSPDVGSLARLGINETCRKTYPVFDKDCQFHPTDMTDSWTDDLEISTNLKNP